MKKNSFNQLSKPPVHYLLGSHTKHPNQAMQLPRSILIGWINSVCIDFYFIQLIAVKLYLFFNIIQASDIMPNA